MVSGVEVLACCGNGLCAVVRCTGNMDVWGDIQCLEG